MARSPASQTVPTSQSTSHSPSSTILEEQPYYHGLLPREEINSLLKQAGDYLVRESDHEGATMIVLSVMDTDEPKHFQIYVAEEGFALENEWFPDVPTLIHTYYTKKTPITYASKLVLKNPVKHEKWELKFEKIHRVELIGKGYFGEVYFGYLMEQGKNTPIAIKTCNSRKGENRKKFMLEVRLMRRYQHPNIVQFKGVCAQRDPIMLVMEFVKGGSLDRCLQKEGDQIPMLEKAKFCLDAAAGMEYLASQNCIHRDLAARNCLLNDDKTATCPSDRRVKIADFGMSRESLLYTISANKAILPIRWTAPEALATGEWTVKSDVWSYGVLMWEIFNEAKQPYDHLKTNNDVAREVQRGYRLPAPADMTPELATLMNRCWISDPLYRPPFSEIRNAAAHCVEVLTRKAQKTRRNSSTSVGTTSKKSK